MNSAKTLSTSCKPLQTSHRSTKVPNPPTLAKSSVFSFEAVTVNERGEEVDRPTTQAKYFIEDLGDDVILEMVLIPGGKFLMGSSKNEAGRVDQEEPQHSVTISPFYMSKFAVTQAQYEQIMGYNPAHFRGAKRPIENVSWHDATTFCQKLSEQTSKFYRLPSEAEWEYACRAGTKTPFHCGVTITSNLGNFNASISYASAVKGICRNGTTNVGCFPPNAFGLYDMHGNVAEWCIDHWHTNYNGLPSDGSVWLGRKRNKSRVGRGGSWCDLPDACRSAFRFKFRQDDYNKFLGFRLVHKWEKL